MFLIHVVGKARAYKFTAPSFKNAPPALAALTTDSTDLALKFFRPEITCDNKMCMLNLQYPETARNRCPHLLTSARASTVVDSAHALPTIYAICLDRATWPDGGAGAETK